VLLSISPFLWGDVQYVWWSIVDSFSHGSRIDTSWGPIRLNALKVPRISSNHPNFAPLTKYATKSISSDNLKICSFAYYSRGYTAKYAVGSITWGSSETNLEKVKIQFGPWNVAIYIERREYNVILIWGRMLQYSLNRPEGVPAVVASRSGKRRR
jgi:hypothetical protein